MAAQEWRSTLLFCCPDAHEVDFTKGGMVGRTPADELVQATKSISNQVRMTVIVLGVIEGDSHDGPSRHSGNSTPRRQMITEGPLGDHNVHGRLRQYPHGGD